MLYQFYLGLDVGQSKDYSALALIEEPLYVRERTSFGRDVTLEPGWAMPSKHEPWVVEQLRARNGREGRPHDPPLVMSGLERFALGTRYPDVISRVARLLSSGPLKDKRVALLVDKTGVGAPIVDAFLQAGINPIAISIHGGEKVSRDRDGYRVPKRDLVSAVKVPLQNGRLSVAPTLAHAATLRAELANFRMKIDPATAHDSYSHWRDGDHDDLVLATAMACWFRGWINHNFDITFARAGLSRATSPEEAAM